MITQPLVLAVQRAAHASAHALAAAVASEGLTPSEVNALANLADGTPRTASQLAAAAGVRPTTLTSLLDRLERRGFVSRRPSPDDRRSVLIEPSGAGLRVARQALEAADEIVDRALGDLTDAERSSLHVSLQALAEVAS